MRHARVPLLKLVDKLSELAFDISANLLDGLHSRPANPPPHRPSARSWQPPAPSPCRTAPATLCAFATVVRALSPLLPLALSPLPPSSCSQIIRDDLDRWPAMRPLLLVLKACLTRRGMNEPFTGGVGSHMLFLMLRELMAAPPKQQRSRDDCLYSLLSDFFFHYAKKKYLVLHPPHEWNYRLVANLGRKPAPVTAYKFQRVSSLFAKLQRRLRGDGCLSCMLPGWRGARQPNAKRAAGKSRGNEHAAGGRAARPSERRKTALQSTAQPHALGDGRTPLVPTSREPVLGRGLKQRLEPKERAGMRRTFPTVLDAPLVPLWGRAQLRLNRLELGTGDE